MASYLPIPRPPRTPTPPTPIPEDDILRPRNAAALGFFPYDSGMSTAGPTSTSQSQNNNVVESTVSYDTRSLSPLGFRSLSPLQDRFGSMALPINTPLDNEFPRSAAVHNNASDGSSAGGVVAASVEGGVPLRNPFNFQTQSYTLNSPVAKSNIGQRRGHRYKHSSVSTQHQIFLEPPTRAPLALPASLPVPTVKEAWRSMSKEQTRRGAWSICHALVAAYVLYSAEGSLALTALSHLIFFDAISAMICIAVDVFGNFEVWMRSSIKHPFGLERAEVLAGFAMSVFLLFMAFDLVSHNLKHVLEGLGTHEPHHPHHHERISPGSVDSAALLAIIATLVSALGLKNHARISKAMRWAPLSFLPSILSNPSHFLTLSCSTLMLLLPLLSITHYLWLDRLLCGVIAFSMFTLGFRLAMAQGRMLLMSFDGDIAKILDEISSEPTVTGIEESRFWRVHYGLCMANLVLGVRDAEEDALVALREKVGALVRNRLGGGYGRGGGVKWEVSLELRVYDH